MLRLRWISLVGVLLAAAPAFATPESDFDAAVDEYYQEWPASRPVDATALGLHEHDGDLDDLSATGITREVERLRGWQDRLRTVDGKQLPAAKAVDLEFLRHAVAARLLDLVEVRSFRRFPSLYSRLAARSVHLLMVRDFAPPAERLRAVVSREELIPNLMAQARANLTQVSAVAVAIALEENPGLTAFFRDQVPAAFAEVKDPPLEQRFRKANARAARALADYGEFLERLQPKANAPIALGAELFRKKLEAEEMVTAPLDELGRRGEAELQRLEAEAHKTLARIDPKRPPEEVMAELSQDHPTADRVLAEVQGRLEALRDFVARKGIATVPSEALPKVRETPPFERATTFASMDTPGPFEQRALDAFYYVTLPDPSWPAAEAESFLRGLHRAEILNTAVHEAFPGHYVQFLWVPRLASKVRRFELANANVEGWAHYDEQMMLDEGFAGSDPKARMAMLTGALWRAARYVVAIKLHTAGMSFDDAVALFRRAAYADRRSAEMEVKRATEDPLYLYYTWGKLEILRLRDDYRRRLGRAFTLRRFHDAFLAEGPIPLPLMRRALLDEK
jgi:uncharacterized protein (DUF885 family)